MLLTRVGLGRIRHTTTDVVGVAFRIECLVMRRLKIVVNQTALLLLSELKVVAFELVCKV